MAFKILDFKCALITGGAGGLGRAMAEHFLKEGKKVIIAGRTESKLQETSKALNNCPYYVLDTGDIASIPDFVKKITNEHPELDCLINNAGVQRPLDVNEMSSEDFLTKADQEIYINVFGPMHLAINLLPHLKSKSAGGAGAVIMNVSSVLGYLPSSIINPVYNGTKAWLHFWSMNLRTQIEQSNSGGRGQVGGSNVRVVEIVPPSVGTDLHRERKDPDDNKKHKGANALTVEEFMEEVAQGFKDDKDTISAGPGVKLVERWYGEFGEDYKKAEGKMK